MISDTSGKQLHCKQEGYLVHTRTARGAASGILDIGMSGNFK